jgi:5'-3' exonuclease
MQVTAQHNEDCKQLLRLMGVPVIDAPSEAEAQCAAMAKAGVVYGAATEDMDCLTFGCPRLVRHLMASQVGAHSVQNSLEGAGRLMCSGASLLWCTPLSLQAAVRLRRPCL